MTKVLLIANHPKYVYNLRRELIEELIKKGYSVGICCPYGKEVDYFISLGCVFFNSKLDRHGKNIFTELKLKKEYGKVMDSFTPDIVLLYTIKPNVYAGLDASKRNIPSIANVTGLGSPFQNDGLLKKILIRMYRITFKKINTVVFQNEENKKFFYLNKIKINNSILLPGSGINLEHFKYLEYKYNNITKFIFISRVMKEKGINEFILVAEKILLSYQNVEFHVAGFIDGDYQKIISEKESQGIITYHGMVDNIQELLKKVDCVILPSYHEGMSNVLLEASASGRVSIASNIPGCKEIIEDGVTGFLCKPKDEDSLFESVEKYLSLNYEVRKKMGLASREKVSQYFDRQIVVKKYVERIEEICNG
jgi:galacturonosyltransferase